MMEWWKTGIMVLEFKTTLPGYHSNIPTFHYSSTEWFYSGIFPWRLFGDGLCLLRNTRSALINWGRVSLGLITLSTSILDAAW
jgi:hypothetical protein